MEKTLNSTREKKFSTALRAFLIIMALLVVFTIIAWAVVSDGGKLKFYRTSMLGAHGETISTIVIAPDDLSSENKYPVAIFNHGAGSQGYQEFPYGIEYARRGFVSILIDDINCGESSMNPSGLPSGMYDPSFFCTLIDYAHAQNWCDGRIVLSGLSAGASKAGEALKAGYADKVSCVVLAVGNTSIECLPEYPTGVPVLYLNADSDWLSEVFKNSDLPTDEWAVNRVRNYTGDSDFEFDGIVGSFEDGTAFGAYRVHSTHENAYTSKTAHEAIHSFVQQAVPTGTELANDDLKYNAINIIYFIVVIFFILAIGQFAYLLTLCPLFYDKIHTKLPAAVGMPAGKRAGQFLMDFIPPFILFFLFTEWLNGTFSKLVKSVFPATFVNGIVFWLMVCGIFALIVFIVKTRLLKKARALTPADYGVGTAEEAKFLNWKRIGTGFLIAAITTIMAFVWLDAVTKITGLGYVATPWASFVRLTPERFIIAIPYLIPLGFSVLITNIAGTATSRRFKDTGNETADTIRDVAYNIILSALPVALIMASFYGVCLLRSAGDPLFPLEWYGMLTICATQPMPVLIAMGIGCSSYLYRKTGNIWTGTFLGTLTLTLFTIGYTPVSF
ncbi:MAG: alpha/beta hydrolase family protein [Desulfitobacteriia bacterium]|jgi:hypothetical protein